MESKKRGNIKGRHEKKHRWRLCCEKIKSRKGSCRGWRGKEGKGKAGEVKREREREGKGGKEDEGGREEKRREGGKGGEGEDGGEKQIKKKRNEEIWRREIM